MPIKTLDPKEQQARDIALALVDSAETEVTAEDIERWPAWDVFEWLEAWGYEWDEENQWWFEN